MINKAERTVADARVLCGMLHRGQKDKAGLPYFTHLYRVAQRVLLAGGDDYAVQAAFLHDVIEDTLMTPDGLGELGFNYRVVTVVQLLTRPRSHSQRDSSETYYRRIRENPRALSVKLADIADNTDPVRLARLDLGTQERLTRKYADALEALRV